MKKIKVYEGQAIDMLCPDCEKPLIFHVGDECKRDPYVGRPNYVLRKGINQPNEAN